MRKIFLALALVLCLSSVACAQCRGGCGACSAGGGCGPSMSCGMSGCGFSMMPMQYYPAPALAKPLATQYWYPVYDGGKVDHYIVSYRALSGDHLSKGCWVGYTGRWRWQRDASQLVKTSKISPAVASR